jgi:hypothetical protein
VYLPAYRPLSLYIRFPHTRGGVPLEETVDVVQERTCTNFNSIEELESWQEKVDDKLDDY